MMTAKARGKNRVRRFDETARAPVPTRRCTTRDVRSIAHLKMLQSLSGKLNRLNDVREIGDDDRRRAPVADRLPQLPRVRRRRSTSSSRSPSAASSRRDARACRSSCCAPRSARASRAAAPSGRVASRSATPRTASSRTAFPGTPTIEESLLAVPLRYGTRVVGVIVISKLGLDQFDEDDLRLLEVLAGHAAVALENARLYESARREAESAKALLEFARELATARASTRSTSGSSS